MTNISIHLTESEYNLVRQHIENKGLNISQYIKAMLLEEIEDHYERIFTRKRFYGVPNI